MRFDLAAFLALRDGNGRLPHRWEFVTTLDFEWEVFTGRRPWKWSFAVYLTARLLTLTAVILTFIGFNLTVEFNCNVSNYRAFSSGTYEANLTQVWLRCTLVSSWFAVAIASFLLVLRGCVIRSQAFSQSGCRLIVSIHSFIHFRVAIWGRDTLITTIAVSIWSVNIAMAVWSAFHSISLLFGVEEPCSCR